ncbi:hypothetical protein NPIL_401571 [Nephila pilipes]|uniref:Uncharacterized protein n=1 Tax=Nephila pilipes TaxID=299642 RepID=A0A8X6U8T1_NEPPI|nr:hypothetical protein NPIL_401571 [Nephila pilipes]
MYDPTKLASCHVPCGLSKSYMCVLNIPAREKVASSLNITELEKCGLITLWRGKKTTEQTQHVEGDHLTAAIQLSEDEKDITCTTSQTVDRGAQMAAASARKLIPKFQSKESKIFNQNFSPLPLFQYGYPASLL